MKQITLRLLIALLTFATGVTFAVSYEAHTFYHVHLIYSREAVLRDNLFQMRKLIDQHAADEGFFPRSLDDLVRAGYLREVPIDPMTGQKDWQVVARGDLNTPGGVKGVIDVHSASPEISAEVTPYRQW